MVMNGFSLTAHQIYNATVTSIKSVNQIRVEN